MTTQQDMNRNPEGKGGFGDNPQNRNPGGWLKEESIPYLMNKFGRMTDTELDEYIEEKGGKSNLTSFEKSAIIRVRSATRAGDSGLKEAKEVMDRTTGKAPQTVDVTTNGESLNAYKELTVEELRKLAGK